LKSVWLLSSCTATTLHTAISRYFYWLIIGSDQRSETKQGKIVRFRSYCLCHFRFIISCRRHFVRFVLNFYFKLVIAQDLFVYENSYSAFQKTSLVLLLLLLLLLLFYFAHNIVFILSLIMVSIIIFTELKQRKFATVDL